MRDPAIISKSEFSNILQRELQLEFSTIVRIEQDNEVEPSFFVCDHNFRTQQNMVFAQSILANSGFSTFHAVDEMRYFVLQGDDLPQDVNSVSYQRKKSDKNIALLPDFQYVRHEGYRGFMTSGLTPWSRRANTVFWRGSTTGPHPLTIDSLEDLPRYRMANLVKLFGPRSDIGFYNIVQCGSPEDHIKIQERFEKEDLVRNRVDMADYGDYKYFIQIDGNGNSWELVQKLRLGCCMIMVDSPWILYHNETLQPWKHYVPVRNDLTDLDQAIDWCLSNDLDAASIAQCGRDYALKIDFGREMQDAANRVRGKLEVLSI